MGEEGGEANPRGGESFDRDEGCQGLGQPFDEVRGGGDRGGEPVAQPPDLILGCEGRSVKVDRRVGDGVSVPGGTPVDDLRFVDRETNTQPRPSGLQPRVLSLY